MGRSKTASCGSAAILHIKYRIHKHICGHFLTHAVERYNSIYKEPLPKITPHVCRHTYCSNMAKSGMNPKVLQYLMGHSDISVTLNVYTHVKTEDAQTEVRRLELMQNELG